MALPTETHTDHAITQATASGLSVIITTLDEEMLVASARDAGTDQVMGDHGRPDIG